MFSILIIFKRPPDLVIILLFWLESYANPIIEAIYPFFILIHSYIQIKLFEFKIAISLFLFKVIVFNKFLILFQDRSNVII